MGRRVRDAASAGGQLPLWGGPPATVLRRPPDTPGEWAGLVARITDAANHGRMGQVRALLPHYGTGNCGIRHPEPTDVRRATLRAGGLDWASRIHWLTHIVPLACRLRPELLTKDHTTANRVGQLCLFVSCYARGRDGRNSIISQKTLAGLMGCCTQTVRRALRAAKALGLLACVFTGRHLTLEETARAVWNGSTQRRFANVYDCTAPADLGAATAVAATRRTPNVHPPVRESLLESSSQSLPCPRRVAAGKNDAAARRQPQTRARRAKSAVYQLATSITLRVIWLRNTSRGRLCGLLAPYANARHPWSGTQLVAAMDHICRDLRIDAPRKATTSPFGLLKWFLERIDPTDDHPDQGRNFDPPVTRCTTCGRTRQVHDHYAAATGDPHPWRPDTKEFTCPRAAGIK